MIKELDQEFYRGLQALSDSSFPKTCATCGKRFNSVEDYLAMTQKVGQKSGLKESYDDDDTPTVELFRNCTCGSTLMDIFHDRRDLSPQGVNRRKKFKELLDRLVHAGFQLNVARRELLKIMRGEESKLIKIASGKK